MKGLVSNSFLFLVVRPGAPSSFLFLVAMPFAPSSVLNESKGGLKNCSSDVHLKASRPGARKT